TQSEFLPPFVGSGSNGAWGEADAGDLWTHRTSGARWLCTTGGVPAVQVWERLATRFSSATPLALGAATAGDDGAPSRGDHVHPTTGLLLTTNLSSATPQATSTAGSAGVSSDTSRADHVHASPQLSSSNPVALGAAGPGVATASSRQDHVHPTTGLLLTTNLSSATPQATSTAGS